MLKAVSMMGEANYDETDTIRDFAVKHVLFRQQREKERPDAVSEPAPVGCAASAAYKDPEFLNDYKKITGDAPSPLTPDEFDEVLKKPAGSADVDLFKTRT
jgi:hypothetical protein